MKNSTTIYKPIFESDFIATLDARKELKIQTVVGSNGTVTTNIVLNFKSDKKESKGYIKAIAFSVSDANMKLLVDALVTAQKTLTAEMKKNPTLSARPQVKETVTLSGNAQIDALRTAGLTDKQITDLGIEIPKTPKAKAKKDDMQTAMDNEDIFTQLLLMLTPAQKKSISKGGVKGVK